MPEEDLEAERLAQRRNRVNTVVVTVALLMAVLILLAVLANRGFFNPAASFHPTPLEAGNLTAPAIPTSVPDLGDPAPTARPGHALYDYEVSWLTSQVFAGYGGSMRVNVTNRGSTDIYVDRVRMVPDWSTGSVYATGWGRSIPAGGTRPMGLLGFSAPADAGTHTYHFELDLKVDVPVTGWVQVTGAKTSDETLEVLPPVTVGNYPLYMNDPALYKRANDLIQPDDPKVVAIADNLSKGLGAGYDLDWVAAALDWELRNLKYIADPPDDDIWSNANETLAVGGGDCEEYALLMASIIEHWGGDARIYVITDHAFAGVYLGPPDMNETDVASALNGYYGTVARYAWFKDSLGYWILSDGTSSQYLGGLPYNGVASDSQGGWDIKDTDYLYVTDVYPDYPR